MVKKKQQNKAAPSTASPSVEKKSFLRREWPLLLYPALILAALAVLYTANRSLQEELSRPRDERRGASGASNTSGTGIDRDNNNPQRTDNGSTEVSGNPATGSEGIESGQMGHAMDLAARRDATDRRAEASQPSGMTGGGAEDQTPAAQLLSALRQAVATDDHARIKQCMNDLVALGDEAVAALLDIVASGKDETSLWAAEALARIGTPVATTALLDTLELVKDGAYKEQLAKRVSSISNHDSWPILLDAVQDTRDPAVQRAAAASLSRMADTAVVDELVARYDAALTKEEADRLAQIVSNIDSPAASDALRSLAGDITTMPQDSLQQAAIDALGNIADPQSLSYLLQKLEASAPGEGSYLFNTISHIDQPQAQSSLLYAAAGNKEVSAEQGRTAAIYALENYPSEETCRLLEQIIARDENMAVTTAALRTLENIEKKQPAVLEKATSKADTTDLLSTHPLQK